jgi:hypothetical protein
MKNSHISWTVNIQLNKWNTKNQDKFLWLDYNHQYLKELRERYNLKSLINDNMDDLAKVKAVSSF